MSLRDDQERPRWDRGWNAGEAGMGALRVTLLFGSAAVALALILTPIAEKQADRMTRTSYPAGVDLMATGTIGQRAPNTYTVRRSVLQTSPNAVCIIRQNGSRSGDC